MTDLRTRPLHVVAQSPRLLRGSRIVTQELEIAYENLGPGPLGSRVHVVDYDASTRTVYRPAQLRERERGAAAPSNKTIREDPGFHAGNAYALVMHTLGRFERALGRRISWNFPGQQLKVVPHAFEEANAFYSRESESLLFGYYRPADGPVFTCLSHDIVVHETTHAILDGLRSRFMAPSSADQAAFHEAFADLVALLSVFSFTKVLGWLLDHKGAGPAPPPGLIRVASVEFDALKDSVLFGLADEMGPEAATGRADALRRSIAIDPRVGVLAEAEFQEAHRRGEILVAAVMRAFLDVWTTRIGTLGQIDGKYYDRGRVAEDGADIADVLLTMMVRAIDYTPPIHLEFGDFLSAVLTADTELRGSSDRYGIRAALKKWFGRYGIVPLSTEAEGTWKRSDLSLGRDGVRFQSLQTDPTEMFRLIWANRGSDRLRLDPSAYTRVTSVRPCLRVSPDDGFFLHETVAECLQYVKIVASELPLFGLTKPVGMPPDLELALEGGSTLILDEFGMLKYEINNRLPDPRNDKDSRERAQSRLQDVWDQGYLDKGAPAARRLATIHRMRAGVGFRDRREEW